MLIEMRLGGSDFVPAALRPNDTAAALRGASTSGVWKSRTAAWIAADDVDSSFVPCRSQIFDWKKCPDGRPYAKSAYRRIVFSSEPLPAWPISTLCVIAPTTFSALNTEKLLETCSFRAFTNCCWRASRYRSESVCRYRTYDRASRPFSSW